MCLVSRIAKETELLLISSSQPSPSPFPAVDMPHRIFTLSSAPMPFNRAEDPPDHCMVCTYVYVCMYHIAVTHPPTPHQHSSLLQCLLSLKIIIHIIPTGVRTKTKSFHWVHVANSSTITKGDPIPYHPHGSLVCAFAKTASHTHHAPPLSGGHPRISYIRQASCLLIMPHVTYCYEGVSLSAAA